MSGSWVFVSARCGRCCGLSRSPLQARKGMLPVLLGATIGGGVLGFWIQNKLIVKHKVRFVPFRSRS